MALRDPGRDVAALFDLLVRVLADEAPARLHRPMQVAELYQRIVPYRRVRGQIGIDQNEDYEMAVLRLLAGEGGYVTVEPPEARETLAAEAAAVAPEPTLVREFAGATLRLSPERTRDVLGDEMRYAPPGTLDGEVEAEGVEEEEERDAPPFVFETDASDPAPPDEPALAVPAPPPPSRPSAQVERPACRSCGRTLPLHRQVAYCPFCGQPPAERRCPSCGDEIETGWRFCIACGAPAAGRT